MALWKSIIHYNNNVTDQQLIKIYQGISFNHANYS